jgi:hypothetical protein
MPISAGGPELLPLVRYSTCLLYNSLRIHQPGDVRCIAHLLVSNRRFCRLLIALLHLSLVGLERGRSTQKPPADPNCHLAVPGKRLLLAYGDPALVL